MLTDIAAAIPVSCCGQKSASSEGVLRGSPWRPSSPAMASLSSSSKGAGGDSRNARKSCSAQRWSALLTPASTPSGSGPSAAPHPLGGTGLPLQDIDFTARSWCPTAAGRSHPPSCSRT